MMNTKYMNVALKEATKAFKKNEIPVGAVIVLNNKIISTSKNNRQKKYNLLGHAEINSILKAEKKLKDWRLDKCEMYVTMYPCKMCEYIIKESRIKKVHYILKNNKNDDINKNYIQIKLPEEIMVNYKKMIKDFFDKLRK